MNDAFQKTMTSAANDAKAQFENFGKMFEGFVGADGAAKAAEASAENLRAASETVQVAVGEAEQIGANLTQHVSKTLTSAFETQAKMLTAGGWQKALEIQYAYMNDSMEAGFAEFSRIADLSTNAMTKAAAPLQARFDEAMKQA